MGSCTAAFLGLSAWVILFSGARAQSEDLCALPRADRKRCLNFPESSEGACRARNCCWDPSETSDRYKCYHKIGSPCDKAPEGCTIIRGPCRLENPNRICGVGRMTEMRMCPGMPRKIFGRHCCVLSCAGLLDEEEEEEEEDEAGAPTAAYCKDVYPACELIDDV